MSGRCRGLAGLLRGHAFAPRFSVKESASPHPPASVRGAALNGVLRELRRLTVLEERTYHGDVCVRCGETRGPGVSKGLQEDEVEATRGRAEAEAARVRSEAREWAAGREEGN